MTIPATPRRSSVVVSDGVTAPTIPFTFKVGADTDIQVQQLVNGTTTTLVLNSAYSVTRNPDQGASPGGSVLLAAAGVAGARTVILGDVEYDQPFSVPTSGSYKADLHEGAFDRMVTQIQQLDERMDRAVLVDSASATDPAELVESLLSASATAVIAAGVATTQAGYAATSAGTAATQAGIATTQAAAAAASATAAAGAAAAVVNGFVRAVASVAALRTLSKTAAPRVQTTGYYGDGDGGGNLYYIDAADTTSADNGGSVIVGADGGRWKSVNRYQFSPLQWGAKGDNTQNDRPFLQAALDYLSSFSVPVAGANAGSLICADERRLYKLSAGGGLTMNVPLTLHLAGTLNFDQSTGFAMRIGTAAAWNNGYDIFVRNIIGQGGGSPTNVNLSGARALLITSMAFSKVEIRCIQGFSLAAIDLQGFGDFGYQQVVQHNRFIFGQVVNNGYGMRTKSLHPATSSVQANEFTIQNIYQNACNFLIDDASAGATNSNTFRINAMDNVSVGSAIGIGIDMWGSLNDFWIGFTGTPGTSLKLRDSAYGNTFRFGNTPETDIIIDYGTGTGSTAKNNRIVTAPPTQSQLPSVGVAAPASGTNVQNTYGVPIIIYMRIDMDSTGSFEVYVGPDVAHLHKINTTPALSGVRYLPFSFRVPAGGWWKVFTLANNVTYQAYAVQDAS